MKISQEERNKIHEKIIKTAIHLFILKGVENTTMREISRKSKIADATIYKYFKSKEKIIIAYFDLHYDKLIENMKAITDFNTFNCKEQLQTCFETSLEIFLEDREFVEIAFKNAFFNYGYNITEVKKLRNKFNQITLDILDSAIDVKEIPDQSMKGLINESLFDYYISIVMYWLKDDSHNFANTSQFIDKSLDIIYAILREGLVNKVTDFLTYLLKTHMMNLTGVFSKSKEAGSFIKRHFMGNL
jgi:AcrR family transcriptional regulator